MAFDVAAVAYARFMGSYAEPLADRFVDLVGARSGQRALDVGCGPGAVTERLSRRLGPGAVVAVDPSGPFVESARGRCPGVEVRQGVVSRYTGFDEWWEPYTLGVGPAGDYVARLEADARRAVEARCRELLPGGPFEVTATAWTVTAQA